MSQGTTSSSRQVPTPAVRHTDEKQPSKDITQYLKEYAREKPDVAALWCFGLGFVIGWKLKPW